MGAVRFWAGSGLTVCRNEEWQAELEIVERHTFLRLAAADQYALAR